MALDFIAGCIGGSAGIIVGYPLDTVKVRLQTQDNRNPIYRGTFHCFTNIVRNESMVGLYKGMSSPMAGVAAINAVVFGAYGNILRRMPDPESLTSIFVAGAAAGAIQSFICSPMELVKSHLQIHTGALQSSLKCLHRIYAKDGYRGVFKGLNITILREGIGFGVYFAAYEWLTKGENIEDISTTLMLLAGGTAGALSWAPVYPLDVIKSRIQVDGVIGEKQYRNSFDCFKKTAKLEGVTCLFRGLCPTLVRAFPTNATTWAVLTWIMRLGSPNQETEVEYETGSEYMERRRLEDLNTSILKFPEYTLQTTSP